MSKKLKRRDRVRDMGRAVIKGVRKVPWKRSRAYSRLRHLLLCSWRGHDLVGVEMDEEAHKIAYLSGRAGDFLECGVCHGRLYSCEFMRKGE